MDLSVCAATVQATRPGGVVTTGGLREVQLVRFRSDVRRWRGVRERERRQQLLRIGYGPGFGSGGGKLRRVLLVAASKSAEGMAVEERKGRRVEVGRSVEEFAEGKSLVHAVHEVARVFLVGLAKQKTLASRPWFPLKWPGADKNVWLKALSYQVRGLHCYLASISSDSIFSQVALQVRSTLGWFLSIAVALIAGGNEQLVQGSLLGLG